MECGGRSQIVEVESMGNEDKTVSMDYVSKSLAKKRDRERATVGL